MLARRTPFTAGRPRARQRRAGLRVLPRVLAASAGGAGGAAFGEELVDAGRGGVVGTADLVDQPAADAVQLPQRGVDGLHGHVGGLADIGRTAHAWAGTPGSWPGQSWYTAASAATTDRAAISSNTSPGVRWPSPGTYT